MVANCTATTSARTAAIDHRGTLRRSQYQTMLMAVKAINQYHARDGGAAGQTAGGGGAIGVPGGEALSPIAGVPSMTNEEREQRLAEELADLMDQRAQGRKVAPTPAH